MCVSRVASAGSSAARASQAAPPTPVRAGRTAPANRAASSVRSSAPTGDASPARLPARTIGVLSAGSRISAESRLQSRRGALDDRLRLRVTGPVGSSDQRGERRELDTGARVHRLDHPVVLAVAARPVSVQLAEDASRPGHRGFLPRRGPQGGPDGLAPQPEPRAVVTEQPTVAVRGPRQPMVGERPRRSAGACDQHGAVGRRCAAREGDLEVGDVAGVAGQSGLGPHPVEVRGHCRCSQRRASRDADNRCLHPGAVNTGQRGAQGVAERRCSAGRIGRRVAAAGGAAAVLATVRSHDDDARRRAAEIAAESQEIRDAQRLRFNGISVSVAPVRLGRRPPERPAPRIARSTHGRPRFRWLRRTVRPETASPLRPPAVSARRPTSTRSCRS